MKYSTSVYDEKHQNHAPERTLQKNSTSPAEDENSSKNSVALTLSLVKLSLASCKFSDTDCNFESFTETASTYKKCNQQVCHGSCHINGHKKVTFWLRKYNQVSHYASAIN